MGEQEPRPPSAAGGAALVVERPSPVLASVTGARLSLLGAGVLWSLGGVLIKGSPASAASITFYRSLFAGLALVPWMLRSRSRPRPADLAVGVLFYAVLLLCYVAATQQTTAANAILLQYTAPIYVILLGPWVLRERIGRADALTAAACMAGIALLIAGNADGANTRGLLLGAVSGFFYGLFILWMRRLRYADPAAVTCLNNLGVALLFLPVLPRVVVVEASALGWLALMGTVQIALPYVLFSRGLRVVSSTEASLLTLVEPLLNPLWVVLAIGERPSAATLVGGGLIVAALAARYAAPRR